MPFRDPERQRRAVADSMRRSRLYEAAVRSGHPKALAAQAARDPMRAFSVLRTEKDRLPAAERERLKTAPEYERLSRANLERVYNDCLALRPTARERYLKLRAEVIAEMEAFS